VTATLQEVAGMIATQAASRGITLVVDVCPADLAVQADHERLKQLLMNLLSNAVKFTSPPGHVRLGCDADDTMVHIRVADSGIGIPAEKFEAIFEPGGWRLQSQCAGIGARPRHQPRSCQGNERGAHGGKRVRRGLHVRAVHPARDHPKRDAEGLKSPRHCRRETMGPRAKRFYMRAPNASAPTTSARNISRSMRTRACPRRATRRTRDALLRGPRGRTR
jgi:hypothetical protein